MQHPMYDTDSLVPGCVSFSYFMIMANFLDSGQVIKIGECY